jgi:hypothetical protein
MPAIKTKFKKATATPKGRIVVLTIFLVFLAAICGGIWYWNTHKKAIIKNKLENAISEKSMGLYQIKYDNLELDEIGGSMTITGMSLNYDSAMYSMAVKLGNAPPLLVSIQIPEISVSGVQTPRAMIEDEIVGRKLEIKNPIIDITYTHSGKDSTRNIPTSEIYKQVLGNLDLIQIDTVLITGAQIRTSSRKSGKSTLQIQDVSLSLIDVRVDSTGNADDSRLLFAKEFSVNCGKIAWPASNKLYNYKAENISINSASSDLRIARFDMNPTMGEDEFVNALPTQDDRFDFSLSGISMKDVDLQKLFNENLVAPTMYVSSATFKIYRDLAIPRDKKNRVGLYPHQVMDEIPLPFKIGKVVLANTFVEYKERNHITRQSGKVQFYNVNATISNFTNDKTAIAANNKMTADVSSSFLNKTPLKTSWVFYLSHPKGRFDVKGSLGAIDATQLNPLTEPMGPATIKEGKINGLEFDLEGSDYAMDGRVKLLYQDLKVALLEKDKGETEMDKKFLTSLLANFIIKDDNPKKGDEARTVQVHLDRDTNRSLFYLCWKTLFKGIRETIGVKK